MDSVTQVSLKEIWALTVDSARKSPGRYLVRHLVLLGIVKFLYTILFEAERISEGLLCCAVCLFNMKVGLVLLFAAFYSQRSHHWNFIVSHVHYFCTIAGSSLYFYNVVQLVCLHNIIYVSGCMHSLDWNSQRQKSERDCIHRKCKYKKNNAQYMYMCGTHACMSQVKHPRSAESDARFPTSYSLNAFVNINYLMGHSRYLQILSCLLPTTPHPTPLTQY